MIAVAGCVDGVYFVDVDDEQIVGRDAGGGGGGGGGTSI
jgi:hypothetical protein